MLRTKNLSLIAAAGRCALHLCLESKNRIAFN